jgi:hypothetical protein
MGDPGRVFKGARSTLAPSQFTAFTGLRNGIGFRYIYLHITDWLLVVKIECF